MWARPRFALPRNRRERRLRQSRCWNRLRSEGRRRVLALPRNRPSRTWWHPERGARSATNQSIWESGNSMGDVCVYLLPSRSSTRAGRAGDVPRGPRCRRSAAAPRRACGRCGRAPSTEPRKIDHGVGGGETIIPRLAEAGALTRPAPPPPPPPPPQQPQEPRPPSAPGPAAVPADPLPPAPLPEPPIAAATAVGSAPGSPATLWSHPPPPPPPFARIKPLPSGRTRSLELVERSARW